jgi:hypothetical protein
MTRSCPPLAPEVEALLERERAIPAVPDHVRARVVARAQAALIAGRVATSSRLRGAPRPRWVVALACAASVAAAATAYEMGSRRQPRAGSSSSMPSPHVVAARDPLAAPPAPTPPAPPTATDTAPSPPPAANTGSPSRAIRNEPAPEELQLLRLARAAVARHDFTAALVPIGEHTRRFRGGRLTEEREALRVKALSGLGRTEEARRAANAFEARFPRSVLLPAVSHMGAAGP